MRLIPSLFLILCLAACHRGDQNNTDAVRQGVVDRLAKGNYNVNGMDIKVADVRFNGEQADATVSITPKGQSAAMPMTFRYHLEHQNNKWVVVGLASGNESNPHGGAMPAAAPGGDPHGGAMPPASGADPHGGAMPPTSGNMPSPQDLPPATKK